MFDKWKLKTLSFLAREAKQIDKRIVDTEMNDTIKEFSVTDLVVLIMADLQIVTIKFFINVKNNQLKILL